MTLKHTPKIKKQPELSIGKRLWGSKGRRFFAIIGAVFLLCIGWLIYLSRDLPSFAQLEDYTPELATKVYSADGVLIKEFFTERRFFTPLPEIPDIMIKSVLATEDHRFYHHWGFVPIRFVKIIFTNLFTLSRQQGASTLTQQLARRLYLTPEKTIARKAREIITAIQIERTYTKQEILQMYLNHMSFGHGSYGVESAARLFFNKKIQELSLSECALLTGMLQRPASLNPYSHPERAIARRNVVLRRMLDEQFITKDQYAEASSAEIDLIPHDQAFEEGTAPYFTEYIRQNLQETYGWDLYKGGMQIYVSLDSRVQACAELAVKKYLPELQLVVNRHMRRKDEFIRLVPPSVLKRTDIDRLMANRAFVDSMLYAKCAVQVAVVALDPRNGHILAMIGGRNFRESQFNRAVQAKRQPGSVFKPFVYTAAVDNGYMPSYEKLNQPIVVHLADGTRWTPSNYDGKISGKTTLREALKRSLNLVTARLVQEDVPPEQVVRYARNLGLTTPMDAVDAIALGSSGVIPLEVTSAFGAFANKGVLLKPIPVMLVEDKYGNVLEQTHPQSKGVLREETAYIMTNMLQTVATRGTGAASVSLYNFRRPAAGKTGTTNNFTDAWYVTFTPQMVCGVWVGLDDPSMSLGEKQSGAKAALPIAATFMRAAHDTLQLPVEDFVRPAGVVELEICQDTKKLATEYCPETTNEIFDMRFQPHEFCDLHNKERGTAMDLQKQRQQKRRIRY
jgi:penicillin-binding protein 1A